mgnify:CR=1 FL=1
MEFLVRLKWILTSVIILLIIAGFPYFKKALIPNNELSLWFVDNDPTLKAYQNFCDRYGNDRLIMILAHDPKGIFQHEKIQQTHIQHNTIRSPFISIDHDNKLYINALILEEMSKVYDGVPLFSGLNLMAEVGERIAVIGPNGIGKTTLLRTLVHDLVPDSGMVKWSENINIGYYAQDHSGDFSNEMSLFDWMSHFKKPTDDEQVVRAILGRLLFSQDDINKSVKNISGGEQGRMIFGRLMMQKPNVLILDEPTNHLDMESIEALNLALENYPGTLIFVSHDREFVSTLATRIIELSPTGITNYSGTYDEYLRDMSAV